MFIVATGALIVALILVCLLLHLSQHIDQRRVKASEIYYFLPSSKLVGPVGGLLEMIEVFGPRGTSPVGICWPHWQHVWGYWCCVPIVPLDAIIVSQVKGGDGAKQRRLSRNVLRETPCLKNRAM
jgi:hypothetical protein